MRFILFIGLALSLKAECMPTLYPVYFVKDIRNNTNSNYIADSQDMRRIYVLPPSTSVTKVQSLNSVTANVGFCAEIAQLQKYNLDTLSLLNSMKTKDQNLKNQIDQQNKKLTDANDDLARFAAVNSMQEIVSLDIKTAQLEKRLDELYNKYKTCVKDCAILQRDIEDSQTLRVELTNKRFLLSATNLQSLNEYEKRKAYRDSLQKNIEDLDSNWRRSQTDLKDMYAEFNRMFDSHARREGGRVSIVYESQWSENQSRLQRENPNYKFEKIQTKNANIKASGYSKNNLVTDGAILAFDVAGVSANGALAMESYPEAFSGNAVLNLLAVCPLVHPELFSITVPNLLSDMSYGLTVSYEYPVTMKYEVTARYNMYHMYELIKSQGTDGGFFSSRSWTQHDEQEFFKDAFSVDWKIEDDKRIITEEQKLAINSDLRRQVMTRLASNLIMNNQVQKLAVANVPATGAMVTSNSLNQHCPTNIYCKGASIMLDVLQAIFGSSETKQSLKQIRNVDVTDRYSNEQVVMQPMLTTYK